MEHLSVIQLQQALASSATTPQDVVLQVYARIKTHGDDAVFIFLRDQSDVMRDAEKLAMLTSDERKRLPLFGIPFAAKDNIDCAGLPTTAGCPAFSYTPSEDAHVIALLKAAGALLIGKTNLDQFATGLVGTRSPYGVPKNTINPDYVPGGSSSGSAVAVAAGLVAFSLGTDTAGSGRIPAAFNNIVGLKPSCGRISTRGVVPACRSIDCVSIFAPTTNDTLAVLHACEGFDTADAFSKNIAETPFPASTAVIGVLPLEDLAPLTDDYRALYLDAINEVASQGHTLQLIDFAPFRDVAQLLYGGSFVAERLTPVRELVINNPSSMDETVAKIIGLAASKTALNVFDDIHRLAELRRIIEQSLEGIDALLLPTAPNHPTLRQVAEDKIGANAILGTYTNFVNLLDFAALAIPAGMTQDGLPFGITLVARAGTDAALVALANQIKQIPTLSITAAMENDILVCVVGAHLTGQPLNSQLTELNGKFLETVHTAPFYKFFALPNTIPEKPGLVRTPNFEGNGIEVELWSLTPAGFGKFVAQVPPPLTIGTIVLADNREIKGFLAEPFALDGAEDITDLGGWRAFMSR